MAASPGMIYTDILRNDFCAFIHRAFLELNPQVHFEPKGSSHWVLITGRKVGIPPSRIIEVTREELPAVLRNGGKRVD